MSIFYRSQYTFNKNNQNYINAIMRFNKNVWITHIDGIELEESLYCKDVQTAIKIHEKNSQNDEMSIQCRSADARSTNNLFPKIDANKLLAGMDEALKNKSLKVYRRIYREY